MGARTIGRLQEDYGARMFFNTLVPFEGGLLKYGVISRFGHCLFFVLGILQLGFSGLRSSRTA